MEENNQEAEEKLTFPECGKGFRDLRGLTSHARYKHELDKEEIKMLLKDKGRNKSNILGIISRIGAFIAVLITLGKTK